ncbi:helicase [Coemansia sp. RSA 1722]|nr:putative ATP-dependent RNA helicase ucp12 [Coemansia sp. RSA 485]KAJ2603899.1 helicase [Coemansia sp. RSA 1722]
MAGGNKKSKGASSKPAQPTSSSTTKESKGSKKSAKGQQPTPPPLAESAPKPKLFDGWTGKTPLTLLNEYVQRQPGWHKPSYNVHGSGTYTCTVRLSKPDVKNLSTPLSVIMKPPTFTPKQPSAVEAKHMAATYALYRMRSDTSLYLSLPLVHRKYWEQLKQEREQEWMYAADPFAAKQGREKEKEEKKVERAKKEEKKARAEMGHKEELLRPALRRRWDDMVEIRMAEAQRLKVEEVVKLWTKQWDVDDNGSEEPVVDVEELVKCGFIRAHVMEALDYAGTRDGVVDWLCVHVPEDDLPQRFMRRAEAPRIIALNGNEALQQASKRLRRCGFPQASVDSALNQAKNLDGDIVVEACAAAVLVGRLTSKEVPAGGELLAESVQALADESDTLRAIFFGEEHRVAGIGSGSLSVALRPQGMEAGGDLSLEVWIPPGAKYPETPVVMAVAGTQLPAYVRLQATVLVNRSVASDGLPVVFDAVQLVEERLARWVAAPQPLASLMQGLSDQIPEQPAIDATTASTLRAPRNSRPQQSSAADVERLAEQFALLQTNPGYCAMQLVRKELPAAALREKILELVSNNRCTLVTGATGCGKTTQVPQFILDDALRNRQKVHIICTQPRRISAIGVAARVSEERAEPSLGSSLVGYAVRGDSKQGRDTRLLFCTTGVLLRMMRDNPKLTGVTHVVCDEVHERSVDSDMLLALLLECLRRSRGLRVVLMSATAQSQVFARYFGRSTPTVDIPGRAFPVEDLFLDDFARKANQPMDALFGAAMVGRARAKLATATASESDSDWLDRVQGFEKRGCTSELAAVLASWDDRYGLRTANAHSLDVALAASAVRYIDQIAARHQSVLVFLPGVAEIHALVDILRTDPGLSVLALHSGMAASDQRRVFDRPPRNCRKVVVATNIAETSITIDDVGFVVDSGRVRESHRDPESGIARLTTGYCSQAAATQRRGRAGRVSQGVCIRLYTKDTLDRAMPEHPTPEILRVPLEQVCLQAKALGHEDSSRFLQSMLTPPSQAAALLAEQLLVAVGACSEERVLLPLGRMMAEVPVDLRLAKMLVYSAMFGVANRAIVLAALMAHDKPLFAASYENRHLAHEERSRFAKGERSDWLADLLAFEHITNGNDRLRFVSKTVVRDIKSSVRMLRDSLKSLGLIDAGEDKHSNGPAGAASMAVLRAMVFAGLSPSIARVRVPAQKYHEVVGGTVGIDHHAKELAFYTVDSLSDSPSGWMDHDFKKDHRVFVHPQSTMFDNAKYPVPFVTYFSLTQNAAHNCQQQRTYMRDVTVPGIYAMFMFGPPLVVDADHKVVCIGRSGGLAVRAWPRVAALVNHLRRLLDELLRRKMADPSLRFQGHPVVDAAMSLIKSDGL